MAVYQLLPDLAYGDAVGNETMIIRDILKSSKYDTEIFVLRAAPRLQDECKSAYDLLDINLKADDIVIYHFAIGCFECINILRKIRCRKVMLYHNITPAKFFNGYNDIAVDLCECGRKELAENKNLFEYCIADSEYNKEELKELGYNCRIDVLPLLIPFEDYEKKPSSNVIEKFMDDGYTNILFVGRIAPNKKQEDIIKVFNYYKKYINTKSRLILVGNAVGMEQYLNRLQDYVKALNLEDVIFTGHIGFDEILAYYRLADIFVCMSEHEGFGVPLVEAMYFDIPIIAYSSSAIPWVLGDSGIIVENKNSILWAKLIDRILEDKELKEDVLNGQRKRLKDFSFKNTKELFLQQIGNFIKR